MSNRKFDLVASWLLAVAAAMAIATAARAAEPKTVADFFLLVPEKYMPYYDLRFRQELLRGERRGAIVDIPNGFISWDASDNTEYFEFAIFRKRDGSYLVAYSVPYDDQFPDASQLLLLSYDRGKWSDDTKRLLPIPYDKTHTYSLPRRGTRIEVWTGKNAYVLMWTNDRFVIEQNSH